MPEIITTMLHRQCEKWPFLAAPQENLRVFLEHVDSNSISKPKGGSGILRCI
jgi:hypothetical protein